MPTGSKRVWAAALVIASVSWPAAAPGGDAGGKLKLDRPHGVSFQFRGVLGWRVKANVESWLIVAPKDNPGLLDMFARRDAGKPIKLVPWAGEFVGKYLISGVQAMRMSRDARLRKTLSDVVTRLVALQASDGYLGPWPRRERLLGHWDLWGHYHVMLGLMLWHEHTADAKAMQAVRKAADLICKTYLNTNRRVLNAGSHEMNMSVIHALARLHRKTGEKRYLQMSKEIVKDFEKAGDYFRTGLKGTEFFRTPRPRWESLHALQGMVELYRITGDERFRKAFLHHRASIRRFDMRNTGGFSSGEKATGNPYTDSAIETCCVIAWQAVMLDALRLTGDSAIADDIELAMFNAIAGAQHPSGAWCTYNTPMNGRRVPSHVSIRFQARRDTPGLNCCSVNGPRGLGMLSEWAIMTAETGIVVNHYGPMLAKTTLGDKTPITLEVQGDYPIGDTAEMVLKIPGPRQFTLSLRIPGWSTSTRVSLNGRPVKLLEKVKPGTYLDLPRRWSSGDKITVRFDMAVRYIAGALEQRGRVSLYRGPILLAYDGRFKVDALSALDASKLGGAKIVAVDGKTAASAGKYPPWLLVDVPAANGGTVRLCDFASAGASGGGYRSWLSAVKFQPSVFTVPEPAYGERDGDRMLVHAALAGDVKPAYGRLASAKGWKPAAGINGKPNCAIELDGKSGRVIYGLAAFPHRNFTVSIWVSVTSLPKTNYGQVFSAWCRGMDDPLRLVVHKGKLHARIEAGRAYGTKGFAVQKGKWFHVAAVKKGAKLNLYIDGKACASTPVPEIVSTPAEDFAIGGNPHFSGPEFLAARLADLRFYAKALTAEELGKILKSARTE